MENYYSADELLVDIMAGEQVVLYPDHLRAGVLDTGLRSVLRTRALTLLMAATASIFTDVLAISSGKRKIAVESNVCTHPSARAQSRSVSTSTSDDEKVNRLADLHGTFSGAMPMVFWCLS